MKKVVFSLVKFIKDALETGYSLEDIQFSVDGWAKECDKMTPFQMHENGFSSHKDWEIEIEEDDL